MDASQILYFAYGSNMVTARLSARVPSCRRIGVAALHGHELRFHKRSNDGSAKCDAFAVEGGSRAVIGALFTFDRSDRPRLDRAEGLGAGYEEAYASVIDADGERRDALTYLAHPDYIGYGLRPYSWYRDLVLAGARESGLPPDYISSHIQSVEAVHDPDRERNVRERARLT